MSIKKYALFVWIPILLSCNDKPVSSSKIVSVNIHNVMESREDFRYPYISFTLEIVNTSKKDKAYSFSKLESASDTTVKKANSWLGKAEEGFSIPCILFDKRTTTVLPPNGRGRFELILVKRFSTINTLQSMKEYFDENILRKDLHLSFNGIGYSDSLRITDEIPVHYYLDDDLVDSSDSAKMGASLYNMLMNSKKLEGKLNRVE